MMLFDFKEVLGEFQIDGFRVHSVDFDEMVQMEEAVNVDSREFDTDAAGFHACDKTLDFNPEKACRADQVDAQYARLVFRQRRSALNKSAAKTDVA